MVIWLGQVVSMFGSGLTGFALGVWVYERTGSITEFTLIAVFGSVPGLLVSPFAGVLIDRWDRRKVLILSDIGAALGTVALVVLLITGRLEIWHIYLIVAFGAACMSVQVPAFMASITMLMPRQHFGRAAGLMQFGDSLARILTPMIAGLLIAAIQLQGVIAVDLVTFALAVLSLLLVRIPAPPPSAAGRAAQGSILKQAAYGWSYIVRHPGLVGLLTFFALVNLLLGFVIVLVTPLVLSFTSAAELGVVLSAGAFGGLLGGLTMGAWGGPKQRIHGILGFSPFLGLGLLIMGLSPSVPLIAAGLFLFHFVVPIVNGSNQAIWQSKVEPDVQGRVFAMRRLLTQFTTPISFLLAGPLADFVFEPMLAPGGALSGSVGRWIGVGTGRGVGLLFIIMGGTLLISAASGYVFPRLRLLEKEIPDAVPATPPATAPAPAQAPARA
jgi:predicted MFS family arabinose efflux permease